MASSARLDATHSTHTFGGGSGGWPTTSFTSTCPCSITVSVSRIAQLRRELEASTSGGPRVMFAAFLPALIAIVVSWVLTPVTMRLASACGAIDYPGPRKIHSYPIPRLGGT